MADTRNVLIHICKVLADTPTFLAKDLQYEHDIYIAPAVTWLNSGSPLEIQVVDAGDTTLDRDGSIRRVQQNIIVAILMRRPTQFEGQHATILSNLDDDLQTYAQAIRTALDGNFLYTSLESGETASDLLVRPLVLTSMSGVSENPQYPDLMIKQLAFTGGFNDDLVIFPI